MGKVMNHRIQVILSESGGTLMTCIRIRQIVSKTGRVLLLGFVLLLVEQIALFDTIYAAGHRKKSVMISQKDSDTASRKILSINADITSSSGETIDIVLTGNFPPVAQVIEGDSPRIVCDFPDVRMARTIQRTIGVNGKYILQIRTGIHPPPEPKSRIVLDLAPNHDYEVEQLYYEKDNRYSLIIREKS